MTVFLTVLFDKYYYDTRGVQKHNARNILLLLLFFLV